MGELTSVDVRIDSGEGARSVTVVSGGASKLGVFVICGIADLDAVGCFAAAL